MSAIRLQSKPAGTLYSFVETIGVPSGLLSTKYYFPTYNNTWAPLNSQLRFSNLGEQPTQVRITIGGVEMDTYTLQPKEERREYYDVSGGPVVVESLPDNPGLGTTQQDIVAAIRLQSKPGSILYSFSETMGIPVEYVSDYLLLPDLQQHLGSSEFTVALQQPWRTTHTGQGHHRRRGNGHLHPAAERRTA